MGRVAEMVNGFPNTRGFVSREAANLAEMLHPHGYQTLAAGKWHLGSIHETSPAGPYDHWPLQRGFDRFHGFMPGETNQWNPELITGNERVEPPRRGGAITCRRTSWTSPASGCGSWCPPIPKSRSSCMSRSPPDTRPTMCPPSYVEKYKGKFDERMGQGPRADSGATES